MELRLVFSILCTLSEHQTLVLISNNALLIVLSIQMCFCNRQEWSYVSETKDLIQMRMELDYSWIRLCHDNRTVGFLVTETSHLFNLDVLTTTIKCCQLLHLPSFLIHVIISVPISCDADVWCCCNCFVGGKFVHVHDCFVFDTYMMFWKCPCELTNCVTCMFVQL